MKLTSTRVTAGQYQVQVHGYTFTLEKLYGSANWTLWNANGVEVNTWESKLALMNIMRTWTENDAKENDAATYCTYA